MAHPHRFGCLSHPKAFLPHFSTPFAPRLLLTELKAWKGACRKPPAPRRVNTDIK